MRILIPKVGDWRLGQLLKNTFAMTSGLLGRSLAQAGVFLVITHILGAETYGAFAAVLGLAGALGGLVGLGTQALLVRETARDKRDFPNAWGATLLAIAISGPLILLCYLALTIVIFPDDIALRIALLIGLTEIACIPISLATISAYQGHDRMGRAARLVLAPALARACAALALIPMALRLPPSARLDAWAVLYLLSTAMVAVYSLWLVRHNLGRPRWPRRPSFLATVRAGLPFAFAAIALKLYVDIDKTMLARLASLEAAGIYSAGYRIIDMAAVPLMSLLATTMPGFFREGAAKNTQQRINTTLWLAPVPIVYALAVGTITFLLAGYAPLLLGESFADTTSSLRWLSWLPLVSLARLLPQHLLVGGDQLRILVIILVFGAFLNIGLNLIFIPLWEWRGAAMSTYASELGMALFMTATLLIRRHSER